MIILRQYQKEIVESVRELMSHGKRRICAVAPCGAGKTAIFAYMADKSQDRGNTVWFLVHRKELLDQTVATFDRFEIKRNKILVGMVATLANALDKNPEKYSEPSFIVIDECHHITARTYQRILERFPNAFVVGLTATPSRLDGKPLKDCFDDMMIGITAKELIKQGYLSPYRYFAPSVADLSALKRKGKDFDTQQAAELLSTRAVFGDVIANYQKYADGMQTICYCSSVKHSESVAQAFRDVGIKAVHFDGSTPKSERECITDNFRAGKITILCNVDLISEGFDVPDCECCILLRPTMSLTLFIQQSMRCMRPKDGKTAIILDHVNNYKRHGLPDDDREWSLDGAPKPLKEYNTDGTLQIRQCPKCFATYRPTSGKKCPFCGAVEELTRQEIKNIKQIQLEEIKKSKRKQADENVKDYKDGNCCKSMQELLAFARKKGYKPQWAYIQAKNRGWFK